MIEHLKFYLHRSKICKTKEKPKKSQAHVEIDNKERNRVQESGTMSVGLFMDAD